MEAITPSQTAMIKTNIIWLTGVSAKPSEQYKAWWATQKPARMDLAIQQLSKFMASVLISEAVTGNWTHVTELMTQLLDGTYQSEEELEKKGMYRTWNGHISVGKITSEIIY